MLNGSPCHVKDIGKDPNYGTFTRDSDTKGMQEINFTSDDPSKGTIEPTSVHFVNYKVNSYDFNLTTLLPMPGGIIKVGNTFVQAKPADGYELSY